MITPFLSSFAPSLRTTIAGLLLLLLAACGRDSPDKLMASAKQYLAKGDRSAAVIQLKNLLATTPKNGEARLLLGQALLDAEDFASAEKELGHALELKQPHEKVLPPYALALLGQGKFKEIIAEVEKYKLFNAVAVASTRAVLGDAYRALGDTARAKDAYAAAIAAVPGHPRARLGEAIVIANEGRLDDALKQVNEVITADPKLAEARAFKADIMLAKGDRPGAKKTLEDAIEASGSSLPARLTLITLLTEEREFDAAAKLLESTRKIAPRDQRINYLDASLAFRKGEVGKARQQVQQVLKYLPNHLPSLVLAGAIDLRDNQLTAAEANLRKVVARAPNYLDARRLLTQVHLRLGQPAKAREALQPLIDQGRLDDPRLQMLAGETYLANGDVEQATKFFQAAAKGTGAEQVGARTKLGQIALATGRSEEGFRELEAASQLDAGAYQADLALIVGHLRRKDFDKAMAAVKALEKKQPKNPLTFQMYGAVHLAKKDLAAARRSFEQALETQPNYLPAARSLALLDTRANKPDDARKRYEAMIAKDDKNEQIYLVLAELLASTGAEPKAIGDTLKRAVAANPESVSARLALISFHLRNEDAKAAVTAAQSALAAMPGDPRVLDAAGAAFEAAGQTNQAIETFNKLAAQQPQAVLPLYRLAGLFVRQKDTDKAIASLRRVQKIAPRESDVVPQLVLVYIAAKRHDDAFKEARELQNRAPRFAMGYSLEGDVYFSQRKFVEAERLFREALKREPKADAVAIKLHGALSATGKTNEADALARKWVAENPKDASMRLFLAERELAAKRLKEAAVHFQAAVAIDPRNAAALNNLAWIGGELGDPKALSYAARALKLTPNSVDALDTYGMLLVKKREADKGLPILERARKLAPARNDLRLNYAKALIGAGKKNEARQELEALRSVKENYRGKDEIAGLLKSL